MSDKLTSLATRLQEKLADSVAELKQSHGELTIVVPSSKIQETCKRLRDEFAFEQLMDLCGVDYLAYRKEARGGGWSGPRFAVVYHLQSIKDNRRLRVRTFLEEESPLLDSVVNIWDSANWYEREAFDLFGIVFDGHPDLRRILTDYGFIGHPFRKDFPISGHVEMRYDENKRRVVYEPVSIEPRVNVPRVIREEGYGGRDS